MQQIKPGDLVDGYVFQGGDTSQKSNWVRAAPRPGEELDGYVFKGGDPSAPKSWLKKDAPRGAFGAVNDNVIEAANAAAGGVKAVSDFISPGNRVSKAIEGFIQSGEESQSDQVKAAKLQFQFELANAIDAGEEIGAVLDYVAGSPLLAVSQAVGSFAVPGGAVKGAGLIAGALGGGQKAVQLAGRTGGVAAGAAMGGGDAAGSAYDAVMDTPTEIISAVPEFARLLEEGKSEDEAKQELATKAARKAAVLPALLGGAFGAVGVEKLLAGAGGYTGGVAARAFKGFASEGAQEAVEEGVTQFEGSRAAAEYNPEIDPFKGVAGAAAMGAVTGGVLGGGVSAFTSPVDLVSKAKTADEAIEAAIAAQDIGVVVQPKTAYTPAEGNAEVTARIENAAQGVQVQPDPVQQRLESAAAAGARLPANPVNKKIGEIQQAIAARGGVATPMEASFLERYGAGKPYDRVATPEELNVPAPRAKIETPVSDSIFVDGVSNSRGAVKVEGVQPGAFQYDQVAQGKKKAEAVPASRVDSFIEQQRKINTPAAQMLVSQFDRGQITRDQIEQDLATKTSVANQRVLTPDPVQTRLESAAKAGADIAPAPAGGIVVESGFRRKNPITEKIKTVQAAIAERGGEPTEAEADFLKRYEAFAPAGVPTSMSAPQTKQSAVGSPGTQIGSPEPAQPAPANRDWEVFAPETGTLNVPRAEMPQVKAENRGAMVNFLNARGVAHQQEELNADSLKPTQAEFSREKVEKAMEFEGGDRSILVSADGYVVDGHHQWLAKKEKGEPVKAIRLNAPIADLLPLVREFPSSTVDESSSAASSGEKQFAVNNPTDGAPQTDFSSSDAPQQAARVGANAKTRARRLGASVDTASDSLLAAIAKMGGLKKDQLVGEWGIDPAELKNRFGAGIRRVATSNGRSLDDMAESLSELGYLTTDENGKWDLREFEELFSAELAGNKHFTADGFEGQAEAQRAQEYEDYLSEQDAEDSGYNDLPEQAQDLIDEVLNDYEQSTADEEARLEREAIRWANAQSSRGMEDQDADIPFDAFPAEESDQGAGEPFAQAQSQQDEGDDFGLTGQTPDDIREQELQREEEQRSQREAEQRAQADDELDSFTLTGSNRAADVGAARGQQDIFSNQQQAQTPAQNTKIQDLGEKIGGARKDLAGSVSGFRSTKSKNKDDRPTWARRFEVSQIVAGDGVGRWAMRDIRNKDWTGQPRQVGGSQNTFATEQDALDAVPLAAVSLKHRAIATGSKGADGEYTYEIWRDVTDRKRVKVVDQVFPSRLVAMEYMAQNAQSILETSTTFGEADLPTPDRTDRTGVARRAGDVEGGDFMKTFGFRGVEFGNWNNQIERQEVMNAAYDGLLDLAEVVGIPPKAIGLNGDLALAFGARGQGLSSAKAHYERERAVINLTKMNGAGALAHEWFHALDHYFGRQDGKAASQWKINADGTRTFDIRGAENDMASGGFSRRDSGVREELRDAYTRLMETMFSKAEQYVEDTAKADQFVAKSRDEVAQRLDRLRADLSELKDARYYKRNNKPATAEQLAEFDTVAKQIVDGEALEVSFVQNEANPGGFGGRWSNEALEKLSAIYKAVRGRSGFDSGKQSGALDRLRDDMNRYSQRLQMLAQAQAGQKKTKRVPTEFAMDAKELDQGRGQDYWTTPHEMAARAFQGYVEDKIAAQGASSPFLNYAPENVGILTPWGAKRPFPYGDERRAINSAFERFLAVLQTKQTDSGVAMFSRGTASRDEAGVAKLQRFADSLTAGWANAPEVIVLDSLSDPATPAAVRRENEVQKSQGASGEPRAFFYDGKVWLVNSQLADNADAVEALFHEALGHYGLRGVFGNTLRPVLNDLANRRPELMQAKAEEYGLDLTTSEGKLTAAEEVLAEMAETQPEISFVRMAVAAVRTWLRNNVGFLDGLKLTNDEIVRSFIVPARDWVQKGRDGRPSIYRGRVGEQPSFSRATATESAEFKRWFGDWKSAQKAIMTRTASGLEEAKNFAAAFTGKPIVNGATKLVGTLSGNNLRKMASQKAGDKSTSMMDHALAIANLDKLFENAVLDHSHPDGKGEPTIRAIHRYIAPMFGVDGSLRAVKLTVKETTGPNEPNPIYTVEAMEIKSPPSVLSRANPDGTGIRPQAGMSKSVLDMLREVNQASKVVDAEGKPMVVYHGTAGDVAAFRDSKTGATYLSNRPEVSSYFATARTEDGSNVMPVYVSMQNPYVTGDMDYIEGVGYDKKEIARLKRLGYDGVTYSEPYFVDGKELTRTDYVAFDPTQVKSATGNNGQFDPANPDIRFSRSADKERASFKVEEPGRLDNIIYKLQDKNVDLKRVSQAITKQTGELEDTINAYQKESLYHGKAAKQSKDFLDKQLRPLLDEMRARKVNLQEFENYLWNRHAPERNEQIAKVNDRFPDGGSGIKTEDAMRYLNGLPEDKRRHFEALAKRVDQMTRDNMQMMVDSGLEKQSTIDSMKGAYKHYVPLLRGESSSYNGRGQGYSIRGATTKRALGSDKPVENIISALADQREKIISRAQKAEVGRALMGLALENPQDDFWFVFDPLLNKDEGQRTTLRDQLETMGLDADLAEEISRQPYTEEMGPNGKAIRRPNRKLTALPNALAVRLNGEDKYIVFNQENDRARRMGESLSNLDAPRLEGALGVVGQATRYFASINTQYNPIFGIVNLVRDTQGALLNLTSTKIAGKQAQVVKGILPAIKAIYNVSRANRSGGIVNGEWADLYERFQNTGGQTGFRDMFSSPKERTEKQLKEALDPSLAQKVYSNSAKPLFDWLSDYNETLENGVRLSAFKAALDSGLSDEQAASLAKELTVNFNRKGQIGTQMGAVYAFFNASTQGTARMLEALKGPKGRQIIGGGILLGAAQTILLGMAGFDDEDPPEFVREKNLIFPTGDGKYITVPMPLGLHVLPNIGRIITEQLMGRTQKGVTESVAGLFNVVVDSFNPVGSSTLMQTMAPTVLDPLVALSENTDFTGRNIAREDFNPSKPTPGYTRTKANSIESLVAVSRALNYLSGGSDYTKGLISPTPDQLEYVISQLTGGVGREISKIVQVGETSVTGEELPPYKVPLLGRFYGNTTSQSSQAGQFYENLRAMNDHKLEIKGRLEDGLSTMDYIKENPEAMIFRQAESVERRIQELGRTKQKLKDNGAGPESIKQVDEAITRVMSNFNDRVKQLRGVEA